MNKIIQIKNFNGLLDQFFDFLEESFVNFKSEFILTRNTMELVRKGNPRLVVEQFINNVKSYKKYIFECDEDFFINYELNHDVVSKDDMLLGMRLKEIWLSDQITDRKKATVFYYLQKLITTGENLN
jgi:hypothetical protein